MSRPPIGTAPQGWPQASARRRCPPGLPVAVVSLAVAVALALALSMTAGCSRSPTLLVTVQGIPGAARSLQALVVREGEPGTLLPTQEDLRPYDLPQPPGDPQSFVLRVPLEVDTVLTLSVAAFDLPGASGCVLRTGQAVHTFQPSLLDDSVTVQLDQEPAAGPAPSGSAGSGCSGALRILSATPATLHAAGGDKLIVRGWGFRPGSTLKLGDQVLTPTYRSAAELEVTVPEASRIGLVPLQVTGPDGATARYSGLRYVVDQLSFMPVNPFPLTTNAIHQQIGDLDGDGRPDLAMNPLSQTSNELTLAFQRAPLAFTVSRLPVAPKLANLSLVDLDGDKDLDLLTASTADRQIKLLLNDGRGFFNQSFVQLAFDPREVVASDFDGDGDIDLAVLNTAAPALYFLYSDGRGGFGAPQPLLLRRVPNPYTLAVLDYNLDGKPDVVTDYIDVNNGGFGLSVHYNQGRSFPANDDTATLVPLPDAADTMFTGDLDADGTADLIVPLGLDPIRAFTSSGGPPRKDQSISAACLRHAADTADLTGDGLPDLAFSCSGAPRVEFLLQLPGRSFAASMSAPAVTLPQTGMSTAYEVRAADLDGDNRPELVVTTLYELFVLRNTSR
ncbi:MAG: FG-GAP-like repeat-containing protein [Polyangia bacterium]